MYWFIAAVLLFVAEMLMGTFYLLVVSASFVSAGLAQWLLGTSVGVSALIASLFSIVGIVLVRRWQKQHRQQFGHNTADDPDKEQLVILMAEQPGGLWLVRYRGAQWQARFPHSNHHAHSGDTARISGKDGNVLLLTPSNSNSNPTHTQPGD